MTIDKDEGFLFDDLNNNLCCLFPDHTNDQHAIRLGIKVDYKGSWCSRMHLNQKMAAELWPLLRQFAETGELETEKEVQNGRGIN